MLKALTHCAAAAVLPNEAAGQAERGKISAGLRAISAPTGVAIFRGEVTKGMARLKPCIGSLACSNF